MDLNKAPHPVMLPLVLRAAIFTHTHNHPHTTSDCLCPGICIFRTIFWVGIIGVGMVTSFHKA